MQNIKLLKEPGYINDLSFIFFLHFNQEVCLEKFTVDSKPDAEHFARIEKDFGEIPEDLYIFFHALESDKCFFSRNYFARYQSRFTTDYGIELLQKELSDYPTVIKRMLQFYFPELKEEEVEACAASIGELYEVIKASTYTDTEKLRLYEFFINPVPYIQMLQFELMQKHMLLSAYYEKNYDKILKAYNDLSFDMLCEQLETLKNLNCKEMESQEFYISFCLLNKNCICYYGNDLAVTFLFGIDYIATVKFLSTKKDKVKLDEFGSALGEESRIRMLDILLERGPLTCKEFEKEFQFSGSTAYHHLTILTKSGAVKTHNEGKTVFYSVNERHFDVVIEILKRYSTQRRRNS